jgi:predicted ATP-grasp superfamily ATP-dependent carboligase
VRSLGRAGIPVERIARHRYEFGLRSRYLRRRTVAPDDDAVLEALRHAAAQGERAVLFLERDENVDTVLNRWDEIHELADVPLPSDPEAVRRLRRKDFLPEVAAEAGVPSPYTMRGELLAREFLRHYLNRKKVRATFAADDPAPAVASLGYLRSRV